MSEISKYRGPAAFRVDPSEGPSWLTFRCEEDLRESGVITEGDTVVPLSEPMALRGRAEPVGEVVLGSRDDEGNYPHAHVICLAGEGCADWDNFPDGFKLYTAPPAPVEHEDDSEIKWRELALQFDGHRMQAICFLKQILKEFPETEFSSAREFLKSGPLPGEEVLRNRIAALAQPATIAHDERYQQLSELYHAQEKRLFKLAQRIKGPSFDKYAHSPSQAIDVLEAAIGGENDDACCAAMLAAPGKQPLSVDVLAGALRNAPLAPSDNQGRQRAPVAAGWIACSERMPEREYVLAADFSGAYYLPSLPNTQVGIYADWFEDGKPSWDDGDGNDLHLKQVTHWMPLPEAPGKEE
ncbi:DUF551 domain-containing protein [Cronobacter malonaticus]|uniref:DUF551 domain-containing protein n=1 Tax=Cronobacter malonaticus TaxID=413503 RepID=UPI0024AEA1FD|nr:DUF551 domain-containing protein [Cronobacter malonaticus]MDI7687791.1 DUF551 domain-containing protein [Cronobacter malonaticus]MDK1298955.1 DUF551 domain-containing protein [Cronobacter malonaticus]